LSPNIHSFLDNHNSRFRNRFKN